MIQRSVKAIRGHGKGFTLIELTVVLAIIAIIALITVPKFIDTIKNAKIKADKMTLKVLQNAVDLYMIDHDGEDMISEENLKNALEDDGYIDGKWPDPQSGGDFEIDMDSGKVKHKGRNADT